MIKAKRKNISESKPNEGRRKRTIGFPFKTLSSKHKRKSAPPGKGNLSENSSGFSRRFRLTRALLGVSTTEEEGDGQWGKTTRLGGEISSKV